MDFLPQRDAQAAGYDVAIKYIHDFGDRYQIPSTVHDHIDQLFRYNVGTGRQVQSRLPAASARTMIGRELSQAKFLDLSMLGWIIEIWKGYVYIVDDMMDASTTRRGRQCWHLLPTIGRNAINDTCILRSAMFEVFKGHFGSHPSYKSMLAEVYDILLLTDLGQNLDVQLCQEQATWDMSTYDNAVFMKATHGGYFVCAVLTLHYLQLATDRRIEQCRAITLPLGRFHQVNNDYKNIFLDIDTNDKNQFGSDIQEAKCSWVFMRALELCDEEQGVFLRKHWGTTDDLKAREVQALLLSLPLQQCYQEGRELLRQELLANVEGLEEVADMCNFYRTIINFALDSY